MPPGRPAGDDRNLLQGALVASLGELDPIYFFIRCPSQASQAGPQVPIGTSTEFEFAEMPAVIFRDEPRAAFLVRPGPGRAPAAFEYFRAF